MCLTTWWEIYVTEGYDAFTRRNQGYHLSGVSSGSTSILFYLSIKSYICF